MHALAKLYSPTGAGPPYDRVLLATGAEPVRMTIPGADQPHFHTLRSFADSKAVSSEPRLHAAPSCLAPVSLAWKLRRPYARAISRFMSWRRITAYVAVLGKNREKVGMRDMRVPQVPFPPAIAGAPCLQRSVTAGEEIHGATHKNIAIGLCRSHK
jgi:hypothetical protein